MFFLAGYLQVTLFSGKLEHQLSKAMKMSARSTLILLTASLVILPLTGCDKVKTVVAKVKEVREAKAKSGTTPAAPLEGAVVRELAESEYDKFISTPGRLSVVVFHANWCGPCKQLAPVMDKVAGEFSGVAHVGRFDVDKSKSLAGKLGVRGIPDVRFFRDGKEVDKFTGGVPEITVREKFSKHAEGLVPATVVETSAAAPAAAEGNPASKDWLPSGMKRADGQNKVGRPTTSPDAKGEKGKDGKDRKSSSNGTT